MGELILLISDWFGYQGNKIINRQSFQLSENQLIRDLLSQWKRA